MFHRIKKVANVFLLISIVTMSLSIYAFFRSGIIEQTLKFSNPLYIKDVFMFFIIFIISVACLCTYISLRVVYRELIEFSAIIKKSE